MVSAERVRQLNKAGWIVKVGRDEYRVADVVQGYIKFLKDEERRMSKSAAASRLQDARARAIELRNAKEDHRLCETEESIGFVDEMMGTIIARLDGLPARFTRDISERQRLVALIDEIRNEAADVFEKRASELRGNG
jgi:phage terminase Nu1 subunit (DNA packaging protein)